MQTVVIIIMLNIECPVCRIADVYGHGLLVSEVNELDCCCTKPITAVWIACEASYPWLAVLGLHLNPSSLA